MTPVFFTLARRIGFLSAVMFCVLLLNGCFSGLRKSPLDDLDEESPTVGGRWSEHGFLSQDMGEAGHNNYYGNASEWRERSPSSVQIGEDGAPQESWVSPDQAGRQLASATTEYGNNSEESVLHSGQVPNLIPNTQRVYKNGRRATRADFQDEAPNDGSLWGSDGQTNYYFSKNKIRTVGDIITVTMEGDLVRDVGIEVRRNLSPREKEKELQLAEERVRMRARAAESKLSGKDSVSSSQAAPVTAAKAGASDKAPAAAETDTASGELGEVTLADLDVGKSLDIKQGEQMLGEIVERYPNGNYKIRATKKVPYKNGSSRVIQLMGVAKGSDISEEDTVSSGKLYEYRIQAIR